jgi:pimeloyl-ACP methyl ester carboxylesterase
MSIYVLVHGGNMSAKTWNKLAERNDYPPDGYLAGKVWNSIIPALEAHGHRVFAPDLMDEHGSSLTGHIEQICTLINENDLGDVILTGHSYGGMIITGVAAIMEERIRHLVYIDAALPDPGQALFDILASAGIDPVSVPGLEPAAAFVEKLQFDSRKIALLPKTYIFCTESEFAPAANVARRKIAADGKGWICFELPSSHVPMASMPERLSQLLLQIEVQ